MQYTDRPVSVQMFIATLIIFWQNTTNKLELALDEDSIFYKLGSSGLISFSDFIFLLTVLSSELFCLVQGHAVFCGVLYDVVWCDGM